MNINYMEEAERYFKHYAHLKKIILVAEQKLDGFRQKKTEPEHALKTESEWEKWQELHDKNKDEIAHVEELLFVLDDQERELLVLYYIKQLSIPEIMREMRLATEQAVYNLKRKAIKDFSVTMFGVCALRNDVIIDETEKKKDPL